jgi:hypothetical protein
MLWICDRTCQLDGAYTEFLVSWQLYWAKAPDSEAAVSAHRYQPDNPPSQT